MFLLTIFWERRSWLLALSFFLFFSINVRGQNIESGLIAYWNFDESGLFGADKLKLYPRAEPLFEPGIRGMGFWLKGQGDYLEVVKSPLPNSEFSVVFWFNPDNPTDYQALFSDYVETNGVIAPLLELYLNNQSLQLKYYHKQTIQLKLPPEIIESNQWCLVKIALKNNQLSLCLGTSQVVVTESLTITNQPIQLPGPMYFGLTSKDVSLFTGQIDEIMIYDRALTHQSFLRLLSRDNPEPLFYDKNPTFEDEPNDDLLEFVDTLVINQAKRSLPHELIRDNKRYYIQARTKANAINYLLELYDYELDDNDSISVFLNDKLIVNAAPMHNRPHTLLIPIELAANTQNYFTFVAMNKGLSGGNTTIAKLWDRKQQVFNEKLVITNRTNSVILVSTQTNTLRQTVVQAEIDVPQENLTLEIWDHNIEDSDFISVYCNGVTLLNYYELEQKRCVIPISIARNQINQLVFVAEDNGHIGANTARVRVLANNKLLNEFTMTSTYTKNSAINIRLIDPEKQKTRYQP
ncbi:MAG: hypothetical protein RIS47_1445 [Bacteroidota bacterium]